MGTRKYKVGPKITSLQDLTQQYEQNNGVYYKNGKNARYFAPNWYGSIKLSGLSTMIREGNLHLALPATSKDSSS